MSFMNLLGAATRFAAAAEGIKIAEHEVMEIACEMVEAKAKGLIGYPRSFWPPLAERRQHAVAGNRRDARFNRAHGGRQQEWLRRHEQRESRISGEGRNRATDGSAPRPRG